MSWWLPALKALLPHVGTIVDAAKPVFTRKPPPAAAASASEAESIALLQQQVAELQAAAAQNATNVRELATQLQSTVSAIEKAAAAADASLRRVTAFAVAALVLSALALFAAGVVVLLVRP
jgi:hypothetical protein